MWHPFKKILLFHVHKSAMYPAILSCLFIVAASSGAESVHLLKSLLDFRKLADQSPNA